MLKNSFKTAEKSLFAEQKHEMASSLRIKGFHVVKCNYSFCKNHLVFVVNLIEIMGINVQN